MNPRIMVVDDDPICRQLAQNTAQSLGECVSLSNGDAAIEIFIDTFRNKQRKFDAILLDFEMPEMNGMEVIMKIRDAERARKVAKENQVKIIMASSHNDRDIIQGCKLVGCNHFILKPINSEQLTQKLKVLQVV